MIEKALVGNLVHVARDKQAGETAGLRLALTLDEAQAIDMNHGGKVDQDEVGDHLETRITSKFWP